jgi:hypothetical protein
MLHYSGDCQTKSSEHEHDVRDPGIVRTRKFYAIEATYQVAHINLS